MWDGCDIARGRALVEVAQSIYKKGKQASGLCWDRSSGDDFWSYNLANHVTSVYVYRNVITFMFMLMCF